MAALSSHHQIFLQEHVKFIVREHESVGHGCRLGWGALARATVLAAEDHVLRLSLVDVKLFGAAVLVEGLHVCASLLLGRLHFLYTYGLNH